MTVAIKHLTSEWANRVLSDGPEDPGVPWRPLEEDVAGGRQKKTLLATMVCEYKDRIDRHDIFAWHGYGVVAPSLATTNGSAKIVADVVHSYLHGQCEIERRVSVEIHVAGLDGFAGMSREEMRVALCDAYLKGATR